MAVHQGELRDHVVAQYSRNSAQFSGPPADRFRRKTRPGNNSITLASSSGDAPHKLQSLGAALLRVPS
eukprot:285226-Prorocentrum_minimum.AAC.1